MPSLLASRRLLVLAAAAAGTGAAPLPAQPARLAYDRVVPLEITSETSANVSLGDLNGDGHLDVVLAKGRHWPLVNRVLLGDGRGAFAPAFDLGPAADKSYSGRLVDLDGDGDLDVVLSNDTPSPKLTYRNDGRGRFTVGSVYGDSTWPMRNATVADMNGDGHPDIIAANRNGRRAGFNYICLNDGRGGFGAPCVPFAPEPATTITAADFTGDGVPDLLVPHRNGGQSRLYLGARRGDLTTLASLPFGPPDAQLRIAEAADFDGDGALDLVAIDEVRGPALYVGRGDGTFAPPVPVGAPGIKPYALTVGDLNCDGRPDFVVGNVEAPSAVYRNDGGFRFTATPFGDGQGAVYGIAIGDVDEDGRPDIAVARSEAPNTLYLASGTAPRCAAKGAGKGGVTEVTKRAGKQPDVRGR
jgi:hypothetical protein